MQVNTSSPDSQRQLLMHGVVTNGRGEASERFVDHAEFGLWNYLLTQKHGLTVNAHEPCVWVPENEYQQHENLFAHASFRLAVTRLTHHCYDEQIGITEKRVRFVPSEDLDLVSLLLEAHFASDRDYVVLDIEAGAAISTAPARGVLRARPAAAYCAA